MTTITRERLEQIIACPASAGSSDVIRELARIALASLDAEPVAWVVHARTGDQLTSDSGYVANAEGILGLHSTPLYAAPPPPAMPEKLPCSVELKPGLIIGKGCKTETLLTALKRRADFYAELDAMTPEERAEHDASIEAFKAMLPKPSPVMPEEKCDEDGVVTSEVDHDWNLCRAALLQAGTLTNEGTKFQATKFKPVTDHYGITSPTGSETSFTFDAIEASSFAKGGWTVQEYVELERYQEAMTGNSPVTQDGWVACSERMPDVGDIVLTTMSGSVNVGEMERSGANYRYFTSVISGRELPATHWMPLPAAPQE